MKLIEDWRLIAPKLWSVRLSLLAGVASAAEAAWQAYVFGQTPFMALLTMAMSFGAAIARVVAQPGLFE